MLEHWVVVHVDLVTLNAAYLDPKSSDTSTTPNDLKELLECEQHNDTAMLAISNIYALASGYACAVETDPFRLRSDLVHKMKALRDSNKPSRRLKQWTTIYGLRTADSIFDFGMPPPNPPKGDATVSKESSSPLPSYPILPSAAAPLKKRTPSTPARPVAPSELRNPFGPSPPMAPSKKRKAEASSTVTNVPAKRRQVAEPPKEDTSSWFFSTWWGKKQDLDVARESMEKLQGELEKAKANVHDIKREMRVLEKRK
ncbi:hypothetical protein CEP54_012559 [Fusarium duplospermum]|uniref:Uncharacterized protein n=1 Tax=Fusarium duplospermum TaxID=1325734 RepID=A0A428P824_9HYPO|nr:hypothetical protein CEP54_012559 [Fusarium duplospermum]